MTKTKESRGGKKMFVLSSSLRIPDPYLLHCPRPLSPWGPPDFLSTCPGAGWLDWLELSQVSSSCEEREMTQCQCDHRKLLWTPGWRRRDHKALDKPAREGDRTGRGTTFAGFEFL